MTMYQGVVVSTQDPQSANRVRLQVPQVSGTAVTDWAPPVQAGGRVPSVGQTVWVSYVGGNASYPAYVPPIPPPYVPPAPAAWQTDPAPQLAGMTLGNGTLLSRYRVTGTLVQWAVLITWGSTSTASPTAQLTVSVPVANDPNSGIRWLGQVLIAPSGGAVWHSGSAWLPAGVSTAFLDAQRQTDLGLVSLSGAGITMPSGSTLSMEMAYDTVVV